MLEVENLTFDKGRIARLHALYHQELMYDISPYTEEELMADFRSGLGSFARHLPIIYALSVGIQAKCIIDLGIGSSTRALRLAAKETGGIVHSCDCDVNRFWGLISHQDSTWKLFLGASEKFISTINEPVDFVCHDAAHDYYQVKLDLSLLLPKMRKYGLICVHDTQQPDSSEEMLSAIRESLEEHRFSLVTIPFNCGLTIIRVEDGILPEIEPLGNKMLDGRLDTSPQEFPLQFPPESTDLRQHGRCYWLARYLGWRKRKLTKGW
jgi:predicted O-methyltransferase YrrM